MSQLKPSNLSFELDGRLNFIDKKSKKVERLKNITSLSDFLNLGDDFSNDDVWRVFWIRPTDIKILKRPSLCV